MPDAPHYCTLFDRNYAGRGLALYRSLERVHERFHLTVLCLDRVTYEGFQALGLRSASLVSMQELESEDSGLAPARTDRGPLEYYVTCKAALALHAARHAPGAPRMTYLDADLYYFSSPSALQRELAGSSVALTSHRLGSRLGSWRPHLFAHGTFNAGWVSASTDDEGLAFLRWWRACCIDWCKFTVDGQRYADQAYLDEVPRRFSRAHVVDDPGANLAPWNLEGSRLGSAGSQVLVDQRPLIFFHFHALRRMIGRAYDCGLLDYRVPLTRAARDLLYRPYLAALGRAEADVVGVNIVPRPIQRAALRDRAAKLRRYLGVIRTGTWMVAPDAPGLPTASPDADMLSAGARSP